MDINKVEGLVPVLIPKEALITSKLEPGTPVNFTADEGIITIERAEKVDSDKTDTKATKAEESEKDDSSEHKSNAAEEDVRISNVQSVPDAEPAMDSKSENSEANHE
jgi:bifunctional DNA-binding transcriptional regulator/antitoxin component of YhaV-PrlF toxin-antitoxin module